MANTLSLDNNDLVWVTTFYGGPNKGTSFTIVKRCGDTQVSKTFTLTELENMLFREGGQVSGLCVPSYDNRGALVRGVDPELERLLAEEAEIEKRQAAQHEVKVAQTIGSTEQGW